VAKREIKAVIKCRRCGQQLPLEERLLDWAQGTGRRDHLEYLRPIPWCEPCYEKEMENREVQEMESWPDLEETLQSGVELLSEDEPPYYEFACPEGSMLMPGEETKW
jgi:hypothetical protein